MPKFAYKGWLNCYQLTNGVVDLVATTDVGPRIIRFGFSGGDNMLKEYGETLGKTGGKTWNIYGGHRLWHAPEADPRCYEPDNSPIKLEEHTAFIRLIQPTEKTTGIQKEIDVYLDPTAAHARLVHRLRNMNLWPVELAPWALSVMAQGGKVIVPLPPRGEHPRDLLPANTLTMWAFTNMSDPRWTWGDKYIMLRQDAKIARPQKIGLMNKDGWVAYANKGFLFVKAFSYTPGAAYPDWGCSMETFTNDAMLEVETLGPLVNLQPRATVEHIENWYLFKDVPLPAGDADVDKHILPKIKEALG
jgi:hypothetical protein